MPGMSGIDLFTIIKARYPDVAVIIVTGVDDRDTGVLAVELGRRPGYIAKPFERNEIVINVANAIERRRLSLLAREGKGVKTSTEEQVAVRRPPIQVSARKVLDLINSGMDEVALGELKLSAKALHSLMEQVVAAGLLKQSEVDRRNSLSPGSVVVDLDLAKFPEGDRQKASYQRNGCCPMHKVRNGRFISHEKIRDFRQGSSEPFEEIGCIRSCSSDPNLTRGCPRLIGSPRRLSCYANWGVLNRG